MTKRNHPLGYMRKLVTPEPRETPWTNRRKDRQIDATIMLTVIVGLLICFRGREWKFCLLFCNTSIIVHYWLPYRKTNWQVLIVTDLACVCDVDERRDWRDSRGEQNASTTCGSYWGRGVKKPRVYLKRGVQEWEGKLEVRLLSVLPTYYIQHSTACC